MIKTWMNKLGDKCYFIGDIISKHINLRLKLRKTWFIATIVFAAFNDLHRSFIPESLLWAVFGMIAEGFIANIGNSIPIFVRACGDTVYMVQNPIMGSLDTRALSNPIFIGLFGTSFDKVTPITEWSLKRLLPNQKKKPRTISLQNSSV